MVHFNCHAVYSGNRADIKLDNLVPVLKSGPEWNCLLWNIIIDVICQDLTFTCFIYIQVSLCTMPNLVYRKPEVRLFYAALWQREKAREICTNGASISQAQTQIGQNNIGCTIDYAVILLLIDYHKVV